MSKTNPGNYFEDFQIGQEIRHATPRTITSGDVALYTGLYGPRFAVQSSDEFAQSIGFKAAPVDDLLAFHMVFGKTVPDVSLNAVANLGYAGGVFGVPVYPGDTVSSVSTVTGIKENSNGKTGVVYVNSVGRNQRGEMVLDYNRWVMVRKRDESAPAPETVLPELPGVVAPEAFQIPVGLDVSGYSTELSGSLHRWDDYYVGEKIDHVDGMTLEEAEHQIATRLYQNTAKVHFDQVAANGGRFGKRLIYGGHIISLCRALSFNGLGNAFRIAAINAGAHANPAFAGDTIFAWSEVLGKFEVPGRRDLGALRLRLVAVRDRQASDFPLKDADGKYQSDVLLDFDYTVLIAR
ncbi:MaoC family dehydratase [Thalassospira indica]|uniref:MaoC family dehydratase n=1 Tax=Thalassospira indica TaxID=1891279 RepID=A0ABM6XUT3_9PROT|nr:MaoC family dehydratase [Thalassospira indica]AXO13352.1 MaoC family dehydratase [Thalassospira indica]OAZ14771.1 dehydratase [Thalassospira profundimaris]